MDINLTKYLNQTWNLEISMEDQVLRDGQVPPSSLWTASHSGVQTPSSSSTQIIPNILSSTFVGGDQTTGNPIEEEEEGEEGEPEEELGTMKEMMYKIAAMQPVEIDPATIRKPKRRNVRISDDPQSVAARHRRERISEKIRILQRLVPGGTKMDTASMLDEAIRYVKFLKRQIRVLQHPTPSIIIGDHHWQLTYNTDKPLGSAGSSSLEAPAAEGFCSGGGNGGEAVRFNREVISE